MGKMRAVLNQKDIPIEEIKYGLATHYHIDHAGLAQEFKLAGVPLLVLNVQTESIPVMKRWTKPHDNFVDISMDDNVVISFEESRRLLEGIGIPGEILHTPGHSDDSISLLLDDGSAFTGDLTGPGFALEEHTDIVSASWQSLRERGASRVHPAHGAIWYL